jgi:hypothetical protein
MMLRQEVFCAIAFAFLAGLGCLSNYLTHHINVPVLTEESEVSFVNFSSPTSDSHQKKFYDRKISQKLLSLLECTRT